MAPEKDGIHKSSQLCVGHRIRHSFLFALLVIALFASGCPSDGNNPVDPVGDTSNEQGDGNSDNGGPTTPGPIDVPSGLESTCTNAQLAEELAVNGEEIDGSGGATSCTIYPFAGNATTGYIVTVRHQGGGNADLMVGADESFQAILGTSTNEQFTNESVFFSAASTITYYAAVPTDEAADFSIRVASTPIVHFSLLGWSEPSQISQKPANLTHIGQAQVTQFESGDAIAAWHYTDTFNADPLLVTSFNSTDNSWDLPINYLEVAEAEYSDHTAGTSHFVAGGEETAFASVVLSSSDFSDHVTRIDGVGTTASTEVPRFVDGIGFDLLFATAAVSPSGDHAIAVFTKTGPFTSVPDIVATRFSSSTGWQDVELLGIPQDLDFSELQTAIDDDGNAFISIRDLSTADEFSYSQIFVTRYDSESDEWSLPEFLFIPTDSDEAESVPRALAVGAGGDALIVGRDVANGDSVTAFRYDADQDAWQDGEILSPGLLEGSNPLVASVDAGGGMHVLYLRSGSLYTFRFDAVAGAWRVPVVLYEKNPTFLTKFAAGASPNGKVLVVVEDNLDTVGESLPLKGFMIRSFDPESAQWSDPVWARQGTRDLFLIDSVLAVAINSAGDATLLIERFDSTNDTELDDTQVFAAVWSSDSGTAPGSGEDGEPGDSDSAGGDSGGGTDDESDTSDGGDNEDGGTGGTSNSPPVANDGDASTDEDTPVAIILTASDSDGDALTYSVVTEPENGTLSGTVPELTYTPNEGFFGEDVFTFKVNDGVEDSNTATIEIVVTEVNEAPVAYDGESTVFSAIPSLIALSATDADDDPLEYLIVTEPDHGSLTGDSPSLTYTSSPGYEGTDSFTYKVNDGSVDSNTATYSVTVELDTIAPLPVSDAIAQPGDSAIRLQWNPSPSGDVVSVLILRRSDGVFPESVDDENADFVGETAAAQYIDSSLSNGTEYRYSIFAKDQAENVSDAVNVVTIARGFETVGAGSFHTVAVRSDGTLWSWGDNYTGGLGLGDTNDRSSPQQVGSSTNWIAAAGSKCASSDEINFCGHSFGILANGTLWGWGVTARLGNGPPSQSTQTTPIQIGEDEDWSRISTGTLHSLALKEDGSLWSWGTNSYGSLGLGSSSESSLTPARIGDETSWVAVAAGGTFSMALKANGTIWVWGRNVNGELGTDSGECIEGFACSNVPIQLGSDSDWAYIEAGLETAMAIKSNGTLWAWGKNEQGILGITTEGGAPQFSPAQVGTSENWVSVSLGNRHGAAMREDGTIWTWGFGSRRATGSPFSATPYGVHQPLSIGDLSELKLVVAAGDHTFVIQGADFLWGLGWNDEGELGLGFTEAPSHIPRAVK